MKNNEKKICMGGLHTFFPIDFCYENYTPYIKNFLTFFKWGQVYNE